MQPARFAAAFAGAAAGRLPSPAAGAGARGRLSRPVLLLLAAVLVSPPAAAQAQAPAGSAPPVAAFALPLPPLPPGSRGAGAAAAADAAGPAPAAPLRASAPATAAVPAPPLPLAPERPELRRGDSSGLDLPRFASLRAERVHLRAGPGPRFPVEWTFVRRDLPVEVLREHDVWRRVRDPDGVEGWVHQQMLSARRTVIVLSATRTLRRRAADEAPAVARLAPGVVARVRRCAAATAWCEVEAGGHRGFLRRGEVWGVYEGEAVE